MIYRLWHQHLVKSPWIWKILVTVPYPHLNKTQLILYHERAQSNIHPPDRGQESMFEVEYCYTGKHVLYGASRRVYWITLGLCYSVNTVVRVCTYYITMFSSCWMWEIKNWLIKQMLSNIITFNFTRLC